MFEAEIINVSCAEMSGIQNKKWTHLILETNCSQVKNINGYLMGCCAEEWIPKSLEVPGESTAVEKEGGRDRERQITSFPA